MTLSLGKRRRLQHATTANGVFAVLAIDHRGPLRRALAADGASKDVDSKVSELKVDIVSALGAATSAVLLDPETGLEPCITQAALPGSTGLLVALDTGSTGDPARLETSLVPDWNAARIVSSGGVGAKLLVYYHPEAESAKQVEDTVQRIAAECAKHQLPFFLEPLSFNPASSANPLPSEERHRVVIETARRLSPLGIDILKAEFPVAAKETANREMWRSACEELTAASTVPWVLLSAGVSYDVFLRQVTTACEAGASGVMAGRAVWKEAVHKGRSERAPWLNSEGQRRMQRLRSLVDALARPID